MDHSSFSTPFQRRIPLRRVFAVIVLLIILYIGLTMVKYPSYYEGNKRLPFRSFLRQLSKHEVVTEEPQQQTTTESLPSTTTTTVKRVNPVLQLKNSGQRVGAMQRVGVLRALQGKVGSQWNRSAYVKDVRSKDNVTVYDYETCPLDGADCLVTRPLPQSILEQEMTYCLHGRPDIVSDSIRTSGAWDVDLLVMLWSTLAQDPEMQVIDMGANIGAMTLVAAKLGRQVVAVEPLQATLNILCKAVIENGVTDKVTIIPNALSDQRTTYRPQIPGGNWGGTSIEKDLNAKRGEGNTITSIFTDDLLNFIPFRKAFLKIDIEGHEPAALRSATKLFEKVYMPVISMEWGKMKEAIQRGNNDPLSAVEFLFSRNYTVVTTRGGHLERQNYLAWPWDIIWLHKDYHLEVDPFSML